MNMFFFMRRTKQYALIREFYYFIIIKVFVSYEKL